MTVRTRRLLFLTAAAVLGVAMLARAAAGLIALFRPG